MTLANTIMKKIYAYPTVIQTSSKITSLIFLLFCLSKKGLKLEKFSSISTLEHNIKEQVSEAHIKIQDLRQMSN